MAKLPTYTEVIVLRISEQQKQTLDKIKERGFVVSKFVRAAIKEKINHEHQALRPNKKRILSFLKKIKLWLIANIVKRNSDGKSFSSL